MVADRDSERSKESVKLFFVYINSTQYWGAILRCQVCGWAHGPVCVVTYECPTLGAKEPGRDHSAGKNWSESAVLMESFILLPVLTNVL